MKKIFVFMILLCLAGTIQAAVTYDANYYQKNRQFALGGHGTADPLYLLFDALSASGSGTDRGFSPAIWQNCPVLKFMFNQEAGMLYFNDFTRGIAVAANKTKAEAAALGTCGDVSACTAATAGTTISTLTTDVNGVAHLESTTDNEDVIISVLGGNDAAGMVRFRNGKKVWAEARVSVVNVTNSKFNAFFGFAEPGLVASTTLISTSDAMPDKDYVGFQRVFADGDKFDTVYDTESATPTTLAADAVTVAADTWIKIGLYCDGTTVYFYSDGTKLTDSVALSATGFPNDEPMAWYADLMLGHGDTASIQVDWVRIAQEY